MAGDAKTAGSYLFNGAETGIAIVEGNMAFGIFAAFTGIALAAEAVHGNGQTFMGFAAQRTIRHGPSFKAGADTFN